MKIVSPASNYDIACCIGRCQSIVWLCLKAQRDVSETWALRDENGEAVIMAGLWPRQDGVVEAWFLARPEAQRHLKRIVRAIRLTLKRKAYAEIEVRIVTKAGARIARLCGFSLHDTFDGAEIWRHGRTIRKKRQRRG
ncbi:hypothetical protein [Cohaesibacter celericrescens]|uniref:N-acetyltransferase domain-containing protein n=1 Tax=Cohaesibacter celericrescens TaxID=2067669 RepID=A0A2N5XTW0_9HYPH|nr:hypothetical protein [Cohaesibacter celericrescens]PLW77885.1 hypothetical protein C0081_07095 [Cohaesibacter celericrescens]